MLYDEKLIIMINLILYRIICACTISIVLAQIASAQTFTRGINVNPWFTKPARNRDGGFTYPPYQKFDSNSYRNDLLKIKNSGFDFIRMPVLPDPIINYKSDRRQEVLLNIRQIVVTALDLGLNVIFDPHVVTNGGTTLADMLKDESLATAYIGLVQDVARIIIPLNKKRILLEVMNEPNTTSCSDPGWLAFQQRIVEAVWSQDPDVSMVLTGSCMSSVEAMTKLDLKPFGDKKRLYATFHYYTPFWFTHQGANWTGDIGSKILTGVPWPPRTGSHQQSINAVINSAETNPVYKKYGQQAIDRADEILRRYYSWSPDEKSIASDFERVGKWADAQGLDRSHVILGEFGVLKIERKWNGADIDSAARWLSTVRKESERNRFPWAMWSYKEGMALVTTEEGINYYPEIVNALGLNNVP